MEFSVNILAQRVVCMAAVIVVASAVAAAEPPLAAERAVPSRETESTLNSRAMSAMLRADRDKDGVLSREELDEYDLTLGRRFAEADWNGNGRLTLYEFEWLLGPPEAQSIGATR
jgi:hypothetical protein